MAGIGEPDVLALDEVARSWVIGGRVSKIQATWFVERGRSAPWEDVPAESDLADADPRSLDGLYEAASRLYGHFRSDAPRGVSTAKLHKVLHVKRPALFPILDSHLLAVYREPATSAALANPKLAARRLYWVAIQQDLRREDNRRALAQVREHLAHYDGADAIEEGHVRVMATLSDLRLLDAVAWRSFGGRDPGSSLLSLSGF